MLRARSRGRPEGEADRDSPRARAVRRVVRDRRQPRRVGETHDHGRRVPGRMRCARQRDGVGTGGEPSGAHDPFGVHRSKARVRTGQPLQGFEYPRDQRIVEIASLLRGGVHESSYETVHGEPAIAIASASIARSARMTTAVVPITPAVARPSASRGARPMPSPIRKRSTSTTTSHPNRLVVPKSSCSRNVARVPACSDDSRVAWRPLRRTGYKRDIWTGLPGLRPGVER
jgi:hypothetical protein